MTPYWVYCLTKGGYAKRPPIMVECAGDQEAVKVAEQLDGDSIEVWDRQQLIRRIVSIYAG